MTVSRTSGCSPLRTTPVGETPVRTAGPHRPTPAARRFHRRAATAWCAPARVLGRRPTPQTGCLRQRQCGERHRLPGERSGIAKKPAARKAMVSGGEQKPSPTNELSVRHVARCCSASVQCPRTRSGIVTPSIQQGKSRESCGNSQSYHRQRDDDGLLQFCSLVAWGRRRCCGRDQRRTL